MKKGTNRPKDRLNTLTNKHTEDIEIVTNQTEELPPADLRTGEDVQKEYERIAVQQLSIFREQYPDKMKKPPCTWFNALLLRIKKNAIPLDRNNPDQIRGAWEFFKQLAYECEIFPTIEAFSNLTGIYREDLRRRGSKGFFDLNLTLYRDSKNAILDQVATNPYTQINKIFLLKSVYGYTENNTQKNEQQIDQVPDIDDIPLFGLEDKNKS